MVACANCRALKLGRAEVGLVTIEACPSIPHAVDLAQCAVVLLQGFASMRQPHFVVTCDNLLKESFTLRITQAGEMATKQNAGAAMKFVGFKNKSEEGCGRGQALDGGRDTGLFPQC